MSVLADPSFGLGSTFHACPFQCSINVSAEVPFLRSPTAHASRGELAAIPKSWLSVLPGLGLVMTLHVVPFQCSTSVFVEVPTVYHPTAQASQAESMATPRNSLLPVPMYGGCAPHD